MKFREVPFTALQSRSTVQPELGSVGGVEEVRRIAVSGLYYTFTMVSVSSDNTSACLVSSSLSWRLAVHIEWMYDIR